MNGQLMYDQPGSPGEANVLRRAKQLLELRWSPARELYINERSYLTCAGSGKSCTAHDIRGIPYSSSRVMDCFVGLDITPDTFLTAAENPLSVLYTRDLSDFADPAFNCTIRNTFLAYGTVCSAFVNYCLALPMHRSTHEWGSIPEMEYLDGQSADRLRLCDTLVTTRADGRTGGHVRIVTGIARDASGKVCRVEISEGVQPFPISKWYTAEEIDRTLLTSQGSYQIYRYRDVDTVEYRPLRAELGEVSNPDLMLDWGSFSNYRTGQEICFNLSAKAGSLFLESAQTKRSLSLQDCESVEIQGEKRLLCRVTDLAPGHYTARCGIGTTRSLPVSFNVVQTPDVTFTDETGVPPERAAFRLTQPDGSPLTQDAACLYGEDGRLNEEIVNIALSDGKRLIPARAAVRCIDGKLWLRTAAVLTDRQGKPLERIPVGEDVTVCALRARRGSTIRVRFSAGKVCTPCFLSWKEEAAITYQQRLLSPEEQAAGELFTGIHDHDNAFAHFQLFSVNEYGRIGTFPVGFVIE